MRVIPGPSEARGPESITPAFVAMDSGLAASRQSGMTGPDGLRWRAKIASLRSADGHID